jgi:hypothetical protein
MRPVRLAWDEPAPADLFDRLEASVPIYGYRTNEDGTETLAWRVGPDGYVMCDHADDGCCADCVGADERLLRRRGTRVVVRTGARVPRA